MRGNDDGGAKLVQFHKQLHQLGSDVVVDVAGRFVGQQQFRSVDDRARNGDSLLFAAGQGCRRVQNMPVKLDPLQQFFHAFAHFALFHAADAQGQGHVVEGRQMVEQAEVLKHDADFAAQHRQAVTVGEVDVLPKTLTMPRLGFCARYIMLSNEVLPAPLLPVRK